MVAVFPKNDFSNATYEANRRAAQGIQAPPKARSWYEQSLVYQAYLRRVETKLRGLFDRDRNSESVAVPLGSKKKPSACEQGEVENFEALRAMSREARRRGVPLLVALLPNTWDFAGQHERLDRVSHFLEQERIPFLSLLGTFEASGVGEGELRLNAIDSHPNRKYNELVAEFLTPVMARCIAD